MSTNSAARAIISHNAQINLINLLDCVTPITYLHVLLYVPIYASAIQEQAEA